LIALEDGVFLRELAPDDAPALLAAVERDREHYDRWLRWTPRLRSVDDARALLASLAPNGGFHLGLFRGDALVGGVVCWNIHPHHRFSEVGYWLSASETGRGLATRATAAMIALLFDSKDVHRIEMLTAETNLRSRAVCERLGFRLESVRRGSHRFVGGFKDHLVYARLVSDPAPSDPPRRLLVEPEFHALLDGLADAWRKRDYARAASFFAEDVSYGDPTRYRLHGRDALRGFFEDDEDREQKVEWHLVVWDATRQVGAVEYTYEGTHRYHGTVLVHVRGGEIVSWREYQHVDDARDFAAWSASG